MAGKSNYLEEQLLNAVFRGITFPVITTVYIALFSTGPGEDGTGGTELSAAGYARVPVACSTSNWKDPASATQGQTNNSIDIVFPVANADWGTANAFGIYDAPTAGNLLYFNTMTGVACPTLSQPIFDTAALVVSED